MKTGKLYLLPNLLSPEADYRLFLPAGLKDLIISLDGLFSENEKNGRAYLKMIAGADAMRAMPQLPVNEHTSAAQLQEYARRLQKGEMWGLVTDCGLPCFADPGAELVAMASSLGVTIEALSGPSSIVMALMLSGFSAQAFSFQGYLPREEALLGRKILQLEKEASLATQIWIETPYRVEKMLQNLLALLDNKTRLCVAANLTSPSQKVISQPVFNWKEQKVSFGKVAAVFLIRRFA